MALSQNEVQIDYGHFSSQHSLISGFPPILKSNVGTVVNTGHWSLRPNGRLQTPGDHLQQHSQDEQEEVTLAEQQDLLCRYDLHHPQGNHHCEENKPPHDQPVGNFCVFQPFTKRCFHRYPAPDRSASGSGNPRQRPCQTVPRHHGPWQQGESRKNLHRSLRS